MYSERLQQVADFVDKCSLIADIGTDHGYIPIWLIKNKICDCAIAADISKGSCNKALNNIKLHRLEDKIQVRQGNGLEVIDCDNDNVDCIIISGMGGLLTISVLQSNIKAFKNAKQLILQPQKDIEKVREFILNNGFYIVNEKMLKENNKFYTVIKAVQGEAESYNTKELMFGKFSINEKSQVLKEYLAIEMNKLNNAMLSIEGSHNDNFQRYDHLKQLLSLYKEVYKCL